MFFLLLLLMALRPFLASLAFGFLDFAYSSAFILLAAVFLLRKKGALLPDKAISACLFLFIASLLASCFWGLNFARSLNESYKFIFLFFACLFAANLNSAQKAAALRVLIISSFMASLYSLYYFFFGTKHIIDSLKFSQIQYPFAMEYIGRHRAFAPFILPSLLGCYLAVGLTITTGYILSLKKPVKETTILLSAFSLPIFISLSLTGSVSAFASIIIALIIFRIIYPSKKITIITLFSLIAVFLIFLWRNSRSSNFTNADFSFSKRIFYWKEGFAYILAHPFKGTGLRNYWGAFSQFTHNSYLQIWIETGLSGFISLTGIIYFSFKKLLKADNIISQTLFLAFLIFTIDNLFDFSFFMPETAYLWWLIIGLAGHPTISDSHIAPEDSCVSLGCLD